jgi:hypothetical protein
MGVADGTHMPLAGYGTTNTVHCKMLCHGLHDMVCMFACRFGLVMRTGAYIRRMQGDGYGQVLGLEVLPKSVKGARASGARRKTRVPSGPDRIAGPR